MHSKKPQEKKFEFDFSSCPMANALRGMSDSEESNIEPLENVYKRLKTVPKGPVEDQNYGRSKLQDPIACGIPSTSKVTASVTYKFKSASGSDASQEYQSPFSVKKPKLDEKENMSLRHTSMTIPELDDKQDTHKPTNVRMNKLLDGVNPELGEDILRTIVDHAEMKLDDIEGNDEAKDALEETVFLPMVNEELFMSYLRQPARGILLFGPPGNGKTMLAKAVATESSCTFFNISAATIMSKWTGQAEKMVQTLFQIARNGQPSVIFIDEVDSILCERKENDDGAARRVKTEFLLQFDGVTSKKEERILVLGATNRPYELDDGILRRFPVRIFIDMPSDIAREKLLRRTFGRDNTKTDISDDDWRSLAETIEGYSNSDIVALCRDAALMPLRSVPREKRKTVRLEELRPLNIDDLRRAAKKIKPSINQENLKRMREFAENFAYHPEL